MNTEKIMRLLNVRAADAPPLKKSQSAHIIH